MSFVALSFFFFLEERKLGKEKEKRGKRQKARKEGIKTKR